MKTVQMEPRDKTVYTTARASSNGEVSEIFSQVTQKKKARRDPNKCFVLRVNGRVGCMLLLCLHRSFVAVFTKSWVAKSHLQKLESGQLRERCPGKMYLREKLGFH